MNIQNAKYNKSHLSQKNVYISCTINGRHLCVPMSENNADYQAILEWVEDGNTIQEAD